MIPLIIRGLLFVRQSPSNLFAQQLSLLNAAVGSIRAGVMSVDKIYYELPPAESVFLDNYLVKSTPAFFKPLASILAFSSAPFLEV